MPETTATIRTFAFLYDLRRSLGEPPFVEMHVPERGVPAFDVAESLQLPLDLIGGAFVNGELYDGDVTVRPGDRVAFVPKGTPAFHPAFFGSRKAS